jgi:curved DNA-binding protein CbpA
MASESPMDYYEALQISASAEPETVHRVYRLLAQRFHPDNAETGNDSRFRLITEAYQVLSDPAQRARYDLVHEQQQQARWRLVARGAEAQNDFEAEQRVRLMVLEMLYTKRRIDPHDPGIFLTDLEKMTGRPREHLEFTIWFLVQRKLVSRADNALMVITAEGVIHLEDNYTHTSQARRLRAVNE